MKKVYVLAAVLESEWFCDGLMKDIWINRFIFIHFKVMYNIYYQNIWAPHSLSCVFIFLLSDPIISMVQLSNQISQQPKENLLCFYDSYST